MSNMFEKAEVSLFGWLKYLGLSRQLRYLQHPKWPSLSGLYSSRLVLRSAAQTELGVVCTWMLCGSLAAVLRARFRSRDSWPTHSVMGINMSKKGKKNLGRLRATLHISHWTLHHPRCTIYALHSILTPHS